MDHSKYLKHSVVYRGPATARFGPDKKETETIIFVPDKRRGSFQFDIVQGSGGNSAIELFVGDEDWRTILEALAAFSPAVRQAILAIADELPK